MKKYIGSLLVVFSLVLLVGQPLHAAPPVWQIDKVHSGFFFDSKHIFSTVRGYFEDFSGEFRFSADNLAESTINFKVKVKSILTNSPKRDQHLRSPDFFDEKKYPYMTFTSSKITHDGGDKYSVAGTMTIKDVSTDFVLPMTYHGEKTNPSNPKQIVAGFNAELTINRLAYHVGDGRFYEMGLIQKEVDITISLEMIRNK